MLPLLQRRPSLSTNHSSVKTLVLQGNRLLYSRHKEDGNDMSTDSLKPDFEKSSYPVGYGDMENIVY